VNRLTPSLHDLFSAAAERWADRTALRQEGQSLSYAELEARAEAVCAHLRAHGVAPGSTIAVWMDRGLAWPAALLGILKAGAAYVAVDVRDPRERFEYVLSDSAAVLVLGSRAGGVPPSDRVPFAAIEDALDGDAGVLPAARRVHSLELAYIIYTSGTTGRPKGVCVTHANLRHTLEAVAERYALGPDDRVLQFSAPTFDVAAEELFATFIRGATVVLRPAGPVPDIGELIRLVRRERLSVLNLPASYWHQWVTVLPEHQPSSCPGLRLVIVGSEPVDDSDLASWRAVVPGDVSWLNAYGLTETTITATVHEPPALASHPPAPRSRGVVPIGRPLSGTRAHVLDAELCPVPPGVPGDLYIAGAGVSRGYHGDPARTAECFLADPWGWPGDRMFATRDRVCRSASGVLEFLGRSDDQIKLRGFRIELAEIQQVLRLHPQVADAVVVLREDRPGDRQLAGYVTGGPDGSAGDLIAELRRLAQAKLPEYMVPADLVVLDALPLASNGKIDRRALPVPVARAGIQAEALAPRTTAERRLSAIWSNVLGTPAVGVQDDFFRLGGHSLLATQVITRVRKEFRVEVPVRELYDHPTVAGLVGVIQHAAASGAPRVDDRIPLAARPAHSPLSFSQQRMWFMNQLVPDSSFFNVAETIRLSGPLNLVALQGALDGVVARHEVLRTRYPSADGRPYQDVAGPASVPLAIVAVADEEHARQHILKQINQPFSLAEGPVMRAGLIRLGRADHVLWMCVHHIAFDEWSNGVLLGELSALYTSLTTGRPAELDPMPVQYIDFAIWHRDWINGTVRERQLGYWRDRLAGAPQALPLPTDLARPKRPSQRGAGLRLRLDEGVTAALRNLANAEDCTLFMVLLALFGVLLHRYGAGDDIPVATPLANRTRQETEALIGLFFNTLVLRLDLSGQPGFREILRRARDVAVGAYDHQDLPFEQLVEALRPARDPSRNPLAQVLFQLHSRRPGAGELTLPGIIAKPFDFAWTTVRVDLEWHLRESDRAINGIVTYATDLFKHDTVANMIGDFALLAAAVASNADCPLLAVPLAGAGRTGGKGTVRPSGDQAAGSAEILENPQPETACAEIHPTLCSIWAAVLKLEKVEIDDDFFDLGGHSLLATQLIARIGDVFGVQLPLSELFERSTVGALAEAIASALPVRSESGQGAS
jgi:amino acid adenylation domain-containing protein